MGMYGRTKYITFVNRFGNDDAIVFGDALIHRNVADSLWLEDKEILGAGFWTGTDCAGDSETLKKRSRPEDTVLVKKLLGIKTT